MLGIPDSVMPHVRRFGFSGLVALAVVVVMIFGVNPVTVLTGQVAEPLPHTTLTALAAIASGEGKPEDLVGAASREANGFWERGFRSGALYYPPASLKMVNTSQDLGCGMAGSDIGTFYCPEDSTVYVNMAAYAELVAAYPAEGHKAQGYMIGRAYGHHVQNALKELDELAIARPTLTADEVIQLEQRMEAQAACYAGVWAKAAGLEKLLDDPAIVAAIQLRDLGQDVFPMPSRDAFRVPETFPKPSLAFLTQWFDEGYGIPAGGSCKLEKVGTPT